jgi:hypothetical protein
MHSVLVASFESMWERVKACEGQEFRTKRDIPFTYRVDGTTVTPDRTGYPIHISQFRKAFDLMPLQGPGEINRLVRGPAYVYAILSDRRTCG